MTAGGDPAEAAPPAVGESGLWVPAPEDRLVQPGETKFLGYEAASDNRLIVTEPGTYIWDSPPIPPEYLEAFTGIGLGITMMHDPELPTSMDSEEVEVEGSTVFRAEVLVGPFERFPAEIEFDVSALGVDYEER